MKDLAYSLGYLEALLKQEELEVPEGEESLEPQYSSSFAEMIRVALLVNFGILLLEFLFLTCSWKSCWSNKRHYWTYKIIFIAIQIPYSIVALVYTSKFA